MLAPLQPEALGNSLPLGIHHYITGGNAHGSNPRPSILRDGLILYRNICVIKYLALVPLSLTVLHSKNVLKGRICWWEALQFG